jgi:hypothetical protein
MDFIDYVSIRPQYLCLFSRPVDPPIRTDKQYENEVNLEIRDPAGLISLKAERRIKNAINWLLAITPEKKFYAPKWHKWYNFKVNFITLTLSSKQIHPDNIIKKKLLHQFLIEAKHRWHVKNYIWRAEAQQNGNIHFHICSDKFIPWRELRSCWNRIQNKLGYVDNFHTLHAHRDPNSTDVHSIKRIKNLPAYLAKYCTKQSNERPIEGKLWGLSYDLSKIKSCIEMLTNEMKDEIDIIKSKFSNYVKEMDYATVIYTNVDKWKKLAKGALYKLYQSFIIEARGETYVPAFDFP